MARLIQHMVEAPRPFSYLSDRLASLEHRIQLDVGPAELEALLSRGWRRFGPDYFRPRCSRCSQCLPTRILTAEFAPTKSQRRARRKADDLRVMLGPPRVDDERLALYALWHAEREVAREWAPSRLEAQDYGLQFAFPHPSAREVCFYDDAAGGKLVGVGICDETTKGWSLVYFFYDPAYKDRSLGVANVVIGVEIAAMRGLPYVYLGYAVEGCASLRYKLSFGPLEHLVGWPRADEEPVWERAPSST
jgi:arginine-tRNA-protein transferase